MAALPYSQNEVPPVKAALTSPKFVIEGGRALRGTVRAGGSKNGKGVSATHEIVTGRNSVVEALRAGIPVATVYLASRLESDDRTREILAAVTERGYPLLEMTKPELDRLTDGAVHQGVAIQVPPYAYADSEDLLDLAREDKKLALEYSHGMKKKLALAAALLPAPDLLFLDEPFEGVDAVTSRVIRDLLAGYVARGSTVFLTSHVLELVEKLCTHVGMIVRGQLVEQGAMADIRAGGSLEDRFLREAGADAVVAPKLAWLEGPAP